MYGPFPVSMAGVHPASIGVGAVGTDATIEQLARWLKRCREPIYAPEDGALLHPTFPGFAQDSPFQSELVIRDNWKSRITTPDIERILDHKEPAKRLDYAVKLIVEKVQHVAQGDGAPKVMVLALPPQIIKHCFSVSAADVQAANATDRGLLPIERRIRRKQAQEQIQQQLTLFESLSPEAKKKFVSRNLRRAIKARVMKFGVPVQLARPTLFDGTSKTLQPEATRAWNFCVALYYKGGNCFPWILDEMDEGDCFVGVSFHRHVGDQAAGMYSSLAQVFSNRSDGVILRGKRFRWDEKLGKSPHLEREPAKELIRMAVEQYRADHDRLPRRVVVHKTSVYWDDELKGFREAMDGIADYDLLALSPRGLRLFREGKYPPVRGTYACVSGAAHVLYTMGYIPFMRRYPRGYVPDPMAIVEHHGNADKERLCRELLALTKMNWNCADFATAEPITLRFARQVGEIMAEMENERDTPHPSFRFYM